MKVMLLIRSLNVGGAERQVVELTKGLRRRGHEVLVATFYQAGALSEELDREGVRRIALGKRGRWDILAFSMRLRRLLTRERPAVLYSWLGVPNILSAFLVQTMAGTHLIWGVRASNVDLSHYDWLARLVFLLECRLSHIPNLIIANSNAGRTYHAGKGFPLDKVVVIPNGIDTDRFSPDLAARAKFRSEWRINDSDILIGLVARLDPMKDHPGFLRAAAMVLNRRGDARFVCVGGGPPQYRTDLEQLASDLGLAREIIWTGVQTDMKAVFNGLDIACSSSSGEGFSNVIAEAMACGVPCVVTDIGDSAFIVGDTGIVVPPNSPAELAKGLCAMLETSSAVRHERGERARYRIVDKFSLALMVLRTEQAIEDAAR